MLEYIGLYLISLWCGIQLIKSADSKLPRTFEAGEWILLFFFSFALIIWPTLFVGWLIIKHVISKFSWVWIPRIGKHLTQDREWWYCGDYSKFDDSGDNL